MATVPEKLGYVEFYELLLKQDVKELNETSAIWAVAPLFPYYIVDQWKQILINKIGESNKKQNEEGEKAVFEKALKDLSTPLEKLDIVEYKKMFRFTRFAYGIEDNGVPEVHAIKLIISFGTYDKALQYLKKFEKSHPTDRLNQTVHEACLFTLPSGEWDIKIWQGLANLYMPKERFKRYFVRASQIEAYIQKNKKDWYEKIKEEVINSFELQFQQEFEKTHISEIEKEYVARNLKLREKEINNTADVLFCKAAAQELNIVLPADFKSISELSQQDKKAVFAYKKSPAGALIYAQISETAMAEMQAGLQEKFKNLPKKTGPSTKEIQEVVKKRLEAARIKINKEIERRAELIFSVDTPLTTFEEYYSNVVYRRRLENLPAAKLFSETGMSEEAFDTYLGLKPRDSDHIPPLLSADKPFPVLVEGSEIDKSYSEYYITKLSPADPRCGVIGYFSSCCQHMDGPGKDCVTHSIESEEGGVYVLCKRKGPTPSAEDEIVSQAWGWRSKTTALDQTTTAGRQTSALVLDSVETRVHYREQHERMIADFFVLWAKKLVTEYQIPRVLVGAGQTPEVMRLLDTHVTEKPKDYQGHRDSFIVQYIIADQALPVFKMYVDLSRAEDRDIVQRRSGPSKLINLSESKQSSENKIILEKEKILEWCIICGINGIEGISYVEEQAKPYGLSNLDLLILQNKAARFWKLLYMIDENGLKTIIKALEHFKAVSSAKLPSIFFKIIRYNRFCALSAGNVFEYAVSLQNPLAVSFLLEEGAAQFVNERDARGWTILMLAVNEETSNPKIVSLLLEAGADKSVNNFSNVGETALSTAAGIAKPEVIELLLKAGAEQSINEINARSLLVKVAKAHQPKVLVLLLQTKASKAINEKDKEGRTVLMQAADTIPRKRVPLISEDPYLATVDLLLKAGAKESICDKSEIGETALSLTARNGHAAVIKLLLENGADKLVNEKNMKGLTPLSKAALSGNFSSVALLLEYGAEKSINEKYIFNGYTALMYAISESDGGDISIVDLLLKKGADVNLANRKDQTPLMIAVLNKNLQAFILLLIAGADVNAVDNEGKRVLDYVMEYTENSILFREAIEKNQVERKSKAEVPALVFSQPSSVQIQSVTTDIIKKEQAASETTASQVTSGPMTEKDISSPSMSSPSSVRSSNLTPRAEEPITLQYDASKNKDPLPRKPTPPPSDENCVEISHR